MMEQEQRPASVISVQDVTDYDPQQGAVRAKRVNIRLWDGTVTYVVVPESRYNADSVKSAMLDVASNHAEVKGVTVHPTEAQNYIQQRESRGSDTQANPWGS